MCVCVLGDSQCRLQTCLTKKRNVHVWRVPGIVPDRRTDRQAGRQPAGLAGEKEEGLD